MTDGWIRLGGQFSWIMSFFVNRDFGVARAPLKGNRFSTWGVDLACLLANATNKRLTALATWTGKSTERSLAIGKNCHIWALQLTECKNCARAASMAKERLTDGLLTTLTKSMLLLIPMSKAQTFIWGHTTSTPAVSPFALYLYLTNFTLGSRAKTLSECVSWVSYFMPSCLFPGLDGFIAPSATPLLGHVSHARYYLRPSIW